MDNWDNIRDQVYTNLQLKTDEELQQMLVKHDSDEWSDVAFDAARQILVERNASVPLASTALLDGEQSSEYEKPGAWEQVNWNMVYEKCQKAARLLGTGSSIVAVVLIVGSIVLAIYVSTLISPFPNEMWIFLLFLLGLGVWATWVGTKIQQADILLLDAKVNLISDMVFSRQNTKKVQLIIRKAFVVTPEGISAEVEGWSGRREFTVLQTICEKWSEQKEVHLLCLSTGDMLGELKSFMEHHIR